MFDSVGRGKFDSGPESQKSSPKRGVNVASVCPVGIAMESAAPAPAAWSKTSPAKVHGVVIPDRKLPMSFLLILRGRSPLIVVREWS
jgi:hypothetical protein